MNLMTYGRKKRRRRSRKRRRRKKRKSRAVSFPSVRKMHSLLPEKVARRLEYCSYVTLDPTLVAPAYNDFQLNSLYDPNITGAGHQPYGFDQLMTYYDHYLVIKASVYFNVGLSNNSGTEYRTFMYSYFISPTGTDITPNTHEKIMEYPGVRYAILETDIHHAKLNMSCLIAKQFGYPPSNYMNSNPSGDPQLWGSVSASPTQAINCRLGVMGMYDVDVPAVQVSYRIVYDAVFAGIKESAQS